jgi:hypothetical protein
MSSQNISGGVALRLAGASAEEEVLKGKLKNYFGGVA